MDDVKPETAVTTRNRPVIAILDDEPDRIRAMLPLIVQQCPECEAVVFENAPDMVEWLAENHDGLCLLSLDHDLGPNQVRNGARFDPGSGRDVADFLATRPARCPVILHTTNRLAAPGMQRVLEESGWTVSHVVPYGDLEWVGEIWIREVRRAVQHPACNTQSITIDGKQFSTLDGFFAAIWPLLAQTTWSGRTNLDAFNDILYWPEKPYVLIWKNSRISQERLGYEEMARMLSERVQSCHPSGTARGDFAKQLQRAKAGEGPTLFDRLVEIIRDNEPDVVLRLE